MASLSEQLANLANPTPDFGDPELADDRKIEILKIFHLCFNVKKWRELFCISGTQTE